MARIRTIKPEFFTNEQLADLEPLARLLFVGLWTMADREGRLEDRPRRIKAEVLPHDNADIDTMLASLASAGLIVRYDSNGLKCIEIITFGEHQRPHPKEPPSSLPAVKKNGKTRKKTAGCALREGKEYSGKEGKESNEIQPIPLVASTVPIPASINTTKIKTAWTSFLRHRSEMQRAVTLTSAKTMLADLERAGPEKALSVLERSIANGYTGLIFDDKAKAKPPPGSPDYLDGINAFVKGHTE